MAAFVSTGWDENLISQPAGSYIIQLNSANLPLPSREVRQSNIYFTQPRVLTVMFQVMKLLLIPCRFTYLIFDILNSAFLGTLIILIMRVLLNM